MTHPTLAPSAERLFLFKALNDGGYNRADIARLAGLSRERVRQLFVVAGLDPHAGAVAVDLQQLRRCLDDGMTQREMGRRLRLSWRTLTRLLTELDLRDAWRERVAVRRWAVCRENAMRRYVRLGQHLGRQPTTDEVCTTTGYACARQLRYAFGSISAFYRLFGIPARPAGHHGSRTNLDRDDAAVQRVAARLERGSAPRRPEAGSGGRRLAHQDDGLPEPTREGDEETR